MKRIIMHWTAGNHVASGLDLQHYHYIVEGNGDIKLGKFPISANVAPKSGQYAAHTLNCNTGSIGVAVAAMAGAVESPFSAGKAPITSVQFTAFVRLVAKLAKEYGIPITPQTVLTHAEVEPNLGIKQRGKWDINWLPGMTKPAAPHIVGNKIRAAILEQAPAPAKPQPAAAPVESLRLVSPQPERSPPVTATHLRVLFYFLAPLLGMLPGVTYAAEVRQIIVDLDGALVGLTGSAILSAGIFQIWGKK